MSFRNETKPDTIPFVRSLFVGLTLSTLLSACSVYDMKDTGDEPDEAPVAAPAQFGTSASSVGSDTADHSLDQSVRYDWWATLQQPSLNQLMDQALSQNFSVAQAKARLDQAYALSRQAKAGIGPSVDIEGSIDNTWYDDGSDAASSSLGLGLSWQLDLFGQLEYAKQRQLWLARAREQDLRSAQLALTMELASTWYGIQSARQTLSLLESQVRSDRQYLELMQLRYDNGVGTRVEVLQQQGQVLENESLIPLAEQQLNALENRLDVLLGQVPDNQPRVQDLNLNESSVPLPVTGIPSSLLLNRPDLRVARAELIAADADIGIAVANRLPGLTLSGFGGYSDASSYSGQLGSLSLDLVQPLLDWGNRKAQVAYNKALYQEQLAAFSLSWLEALAEVENGLLQEQKQRQHLQLLEQRREVLQETLDESEARFEQGVDDYLPVLSALASLRSLERDLVEQRLTLITQRINLYGAIGGVIPTSPNEESPNEESPDAASPSAALPAATDFTLSERSDAHGEPAHVSL